MMSYKILRLTGSLIRNNLRFNLYYVGFEVYLFFSQHSVRLKIGKFVLFSNNVFGNWHLEFISSSVEVEHN